MVFFREHSCGFASFEMFQKKKTCLNGKKIKSFYELFFKRILMNTRFTIYFFHRCIFWCIVFTAAKLERFKLFIIKTTRIMRISTSSWVQDRRGFSSVAYSTGRKAIAHPRQLVSFHTHYWCPFIKTTLRIFSTLPPAHTCMIIIIMFSL